MSEQPLLNALTKVQSKLSGLYSIALKHHDLSELTYAHLTLLIQLYEYKELPMKALAELTQRDKSTITPLITKLLNLGYVIKMQDNHDKRISNISITQKGLTQKTIIENISKQLFDRLNLKTTVSERQTLVRLLDKISDSL